MKRILLAAIATVSLLVTIPALSTAASHHGRSRGHGVERRHHHRRHAVRHEHFRARHHDDATGPGTRTTPSGAAATLA